MTPIEFYCLLAGGTAIVTLVICLIVYWFAKKFSNPIDELDDQDLADLDKIVDTATNMTANYGNFLFK